MIDPAADGIPITADLRHLELGTPAVIRERLHRYLVPIRTVFLAVLQDTGNAVMAVGEDIRLDAHDFSDGAFDRETASIDLGRDTLDKNAVAAFLRDRRHGTRYSCVKKSALNGLGSSTQYFNVSRIQRMFHFKPKPRPPTYTGRETIRDTLHVRIVAVDRFKDECGAGGCES